MSSSSFILSAMPLPMIVMYRRLRTVLAVDRRMRAALVGYLIPAVFIALLESSSWTASLVPFNLLVTAKNSTANSTSSGEPTEPYLLSALSISVPSCVFRFIGLLIISYVMADPAQYKYSMQAFVLGTISGFALAQLANSGTSTYTKTFSAYLYIVANFHFSEFFVTGLMGSEMLKPDSFLLNHSKSYWTALIVSWIEFLLESFVPALHLPIISALGVVLCVAGELMRKLAMYYAASGFTHQIAVRRKKNHVLVTSGVYSLCRHPGYLGWMMWSIGTQLVLCNPICTLAYIYVVYQFFEDRIYDEERYLIEFFGEQYIVYQQHVPSGIPGVRGFVVRA